MPREYSPENEFLESISVNNIIESLKHRTFSEHDIKELQNLIAQHVPTQESNVDKNLGKKNHNKALISSIENDDIVNFIHILKKENVNIPDESGTTPLIAAVKIHNIVMINKILSLNPDLEAEDRKGETALSYAIKNRDIGVATILKAKMNLL